jgi:uncharacterized protein
MRRASCLSLVLIVVVLAAPLASAQDYPSYADPYVDDFAGIFSPSEASHLRSLLQGVKDQTTAEAVVVTVPTVAPLEPQQYATELFARWGVGSKENDNGLLILYAQAEERIWVTTGYGLEGILPDSRIGRLLDDYYVPLRDSCNVTAGIIAFTYAASQVIVDNKDEVAAGPDPLQPLRDILSGPYIIMLLAYILFISMGVLSATGLLAPRCPEDGLRMRYVRTEGRYAVYKCPKGHVVRKKRKRAVFVAGGFAGGGFGGGFGGGGFGGGGTGGGGAGR